MSSSKEILRNYIDLSLAILEKEDGNNRNDKEGGPPVLFHHSGHQLSNNTTYQNDALLVYDQRRPPPSRALLSSGGAGSTFQQGTTTTSKDCIVSDAARQLSPSSSTLSFQMRAALEEIQELNQQAKYCLEDAMISSAVQAKLALHHAIEHEKTAAMEQSIILNYLKSSYTCPSSLDDPRIHGHSDCDHEGNNSITRILKQAQLLPETHTARMPVAVVAGHRGDLPPSPSIFEMMVMQDSQRQLSCASSMILAHHQQAQDTTARRTARTEDVHARSRLLEDKAEAPRRTLEALGQLLRTKDDQYVDVMPLLSTMSIVEEDIKKARGGVTEQFPARLHRMLSESEESGLSDVIAFFPHGRAFSIFKPERFVSEILPKYFKQSRLGSFQRQLNLYGFKRKGSGPDEGGYYHELFLKDQPALCHFMRRAGVSALSKHQDRRRTTAGTNEDTFDKEPNFYAMTHPSPTAKEKDI